MKKPSKIYYIKLFLGALEETFQLKRIIPYWVPVYAWAFLIFYLSSIPNLATGLPHAWDMVLRKMGHVGEYFVLTALIWRAFRSYGFPSRDCFALGAAGALIYAASDEIHQLFVPLRHGCIIDVLIDAIGIILFGILISLLNRKKKVS